MSEQERDLFDNYASGYATGRREAAAAVNALPVRYDGVENWVRLRDAVNAAAAT